jgi:glycosyltransferase involved in cell wall biosynthesis
MSRQQQLEVAVLLPTYNGERYVEEQLRSLKRNDTKFTLHWLDDHSTDNTREIVRSVAHDAGIELREWHQSRHLGVPGVFFQILECVEADIYLFCDQDDIWQTGKIDATVANLLPDLDSPVMVFTDPLVFNDDRPDRHFRMLDMMHVTLEEALQESRIFMPVVTWGHTQGFTRSLRELYIRHKDIAREHAAMHDVWMYGIAVASGTARLLPGAPTALYRWHGNNWCRAYFDWGSRDTLRLTATWSQYQLVRRLVSRNAEGFVLASATLPRSVKLDRLLTIAKLVAVIHKRQSPSALIMLLRRRALWPYRRLAFGTAAACLCSNAIP